MRKRPYWKTYKHREFFIDDDFARLLNHASAPARTSLELILNGDIFDFDAVTAVPSCRIVDVNSNEPQDGPGDGNTAIDWEITGPFTVNYTVSGTAANGADYAALSGSVTIPNGSASTTITVNPVEELAVEPTESVVLTLTASASYAINPSFSSATVNILDNDVYAITINDVAVTETDTGTLNAVFTVSLSTASDRTVTVDYATSTSPYWYGNSATAGSDFEAAAAMLTEVRTISDATGQAFFSLSLGMGAMLTFSSYLSKEESLPREATVISFSDFAVAFLAGDGL